LLAVLAVPLGILGTAVAAAGIKNLLSILLLVLFLSPLWLAVVLARRERKERL